LNAASQCLSKIYNNNYGSLITAVILTEKKMSSCGEQETFVDPSKVIKCLSV